jgi:hypothetical protein
MAPVLGIAFQLGHTGQYLMARLSDLDQSVRAPARLGHRAGAVVHGGALLGGRRIRAEMGMAVQNRAHAEAVDRLGQA